MSYILDALQRAEAERARGRVPTLHARPVADATATHTLAMSQRVGLAMAGLVALLLTAALARWIWGSAAPQPPPASVAAQAPSLQQPAVPAAAVPAPQPTLPVADKASLPPPAPAKPPVVAVAPKVPASAGTPMAKPAVAVALAPLLSELPEATRREIPALAISGAVYSENPAQRLLLVNGQVLNQGSEVAPELKVVEIRSNATEFSFRGTRFRLAH